MLKVVFAFSKNSCGEFPRNRTELRVFVSIHCKLKTFTVIRFMKSFVCFK